MRRVTLLPPGLHLAWLPYSWLVYLSIYFVFPTIGRYSAARWALVLAGVALFLPLYFRAFWLQGRPLLWVSAALTALGVVLIPWNPGASVMFVYAAGFRMGVRDQGCLRQGLWLPAIQLARRGLHRQVRLLLHQDAEFHELRQAV